MARTNPQNEQQKDPQFIQLKPFPALGLCPLTQVSFYEDLLVTSTTRLFYLFLLSAILTINHKVPLSQQATFFILIFTSLDPLFFLRVIQANFFDLHSFEAENLCCSYLL
jgi:hypothetical protein